MWDITVDLIDNKMIENVIKHLMSLNSSTLMKWENSLKTQTDRVHSRNSMS